MDLDRRWADGARPLHGFLAQGRATASRSPYRCARIVVSLAVMPDESDARLRPPRRRGRAPVWYGGLGPGLLVIACAGRTPPLFIFGDPEPSRDAARDDLVRWRSDSLVARRGRLGQHPPCARTRPGGRAVGEAQVVGCGPRGAPRLSSALSAAADVVRRRHELIDADAAGSSARRWHSVVSWRATSRRRRSRGLARPSGRCIRPAEGLGCLHRIARPGTEPRRRDDANVRGDVPGRRALDAERPGARSPSRSGSRAGRRLDGLLFDRSDVVDPDERGPRDRRRRSRRASARARAASTSRSWSRDGASTGSCASRLASTPTAARGRRRRSAARRRTDFGADVAMLWRVNGDRLELERVRPRVEPLHSRPRVRSRRLSAASRRCSRAQRVVRARREAEALGEGLVRVRGSASARRFASLS